MTNEIRSRLNQIKIENNIWIIYIGIIIFSWYSNYLEKNYLLSGNSTIKKEYRSIMIIIFSILVIVYSYFLYSSYQDVTSLKESDSDKKKNLVYLSFISSLLIFISGLIFLYIALSDDDLNVEIAFN